MGDKEAKEGAERKAREKEEKEAEKERVKQEKEATKAKEKEEKQAEKERVKQEKEERKAQEKEAKRREGRKIEQPSDDDDYDPYENRTGNDLTKNWEAWVNLVKSSVGAGLLGMPRAFSNAGLICGTISTVLIGIFCVYTLQILIRAMYEICKWKKISQISYQDAMKEAILHGPERLHKAAAPMGYIVEFFLTFYQIGILAVYVVFISTNIKQVVEINAPDQIIPVVIYMVAVTFLLMFLNQIRNLKRLAPVSVVANISLMVGICCILYYVFRKLPDIKERELFASYRTYPLYLGTVLFALEAVAVIISVENHMRTPRDFPGPCGVLNLGMVVVVVLYAFVGFVGYWRYGKNTQGSITLNIAPDERLAQVAKMLISFAILLSYPLQAHPAVEVLWDKYLSRFFVENSTAVYVIMETVVRCAIVVISFILAVSVPDIGDIISLIGSFCLSMLAVGFPPVVHAFAFYPDKLGKYKWMLYKDILVFIAGLLTLLVGMYASVYELMNK